MTKKNLALTITIFLLVIMSNYGNAFSVNRLIEILQIEVDLLSFSPPTLWYLSKESNTTDFSTTFISSWSYVPVICGTEFGKAIRKRHAHLASFVILSVVPSTLDSEQDTEDFITMMKLNGNRRRDRFIFMGSEEKIQEINKDEFIHDLQFKIGVTADRILIDPSYFNPTGSMIPLNDISQRIMRGTIGWNLYGRHLKISGCLLPTWMYRISNENDPQGVQYDGSHYRLIVEASRRFNFTFEIHAPVDQGYGQLLPNGTWTGMAADLYYTERKFDMVILLGHVLSWYHFVDFASGLDFARLLFVTSHPQLDINWEAFILPFQFPVWIALVGVYFGVSGAILILLLTRKMGHGIFKRVHKLHSHRYADILHMALCVPYGIALEQPTIIPRNIRYLSALWMLAIITTGTGYRSNLASYLSFPTITPVPRTFLELAKRKDYKIYLNNLGEAEKHFFEHTNSPDIIAIRKRLEFIPNPIECATKALVMKKTACISWTPLITAFADGELAINTRLPTLTLSKQHALSALMSFGFLKDSPIVDAFTPISQGIYETGILNVWNENAYYYFRLKGKKKKKDPLVYRKMKQYEESMGAFTGSKPFSMDNLKLPFYLIIIGALLSTMSFGIEFLQRILDGCCNRPKAQDDMRKNTVKITVSSVLGMIEATSKL